MRNLQWMMQHANFRLMLVVLIAALCLPPNAPAQIPSGVCNFAKVNDYLDRGYVTVRSGPGIEFRKIARLPSGRVVYTCDESRDWIEIFYSDPNGPCSPSFTNGLDMRKAVSCQSGWVEKKWIDVISG